MNTDWRAELDKQKARMGVADGPPPPAPSSPALFKMLVTSVNEFGIFMLDSSGRILTWNQGARRIKQYREEDVIGRHFRMLYTPGDRDAGRPEKNLHDALKYGQTEDVGWRMKKDGTWFWADVVITAILDDDGHVLGFAKVIRDLTEVNKAEAHARALAVSEKVNYLKTEFLSLISHELRTPLTAIMGFANLVEDGSAGPTTPEQNSFIASILKATDSLTKLVNDLIDMASLRAGTLKLECRALNFSELVLGSVYAVQAKAQDKHLWLANHVTPSLPEVVADPERLSQILIHLLDNAIKFTPDGGRIDIGASVQDGTLRCEVSDTGRGLSLEAMEHLFKDFSQADMSATRTEGGLGIGLSLSKRLIEAHGGQIGVLSREAGGSTFWFTLPRAAVTVGSRP